MVFESSSLYQDANFPFSLFSQGVIEFSLCLLFAKLVSYTFLFWLPLYITNVGKYHSKGIQNCDYKVSGNKSLK